MLSYEEFKESKRTDLVYRFLLWFFFAHFILYCESKFNGIGDTYIEKVTTYFSSYRFNFLIGIGLFLSAMAIALKDLELFITKTPKFNQFARLNFFVKESSSLLTKISSDFLLITYAMMSFLVGNVVFIYYHFYDESPGNKVMRALLVFFIIMVLLGYMSYIIRSINEGRFYRNFGFYHLKYDWYTIH